MQTKYRKYAVANSLNWFATRLLRVTKIFCSLLISYAIRLNPEREIFQKNLKSLKINPNSFFRKSQKKFPFYGVADGCSLLSKKIEFFTRDQKVQLSLPKVINNDFKISEKHICEARLPDTYLVELDNVIMFGGTDLILVDNVILYDEISDKSMIGIYANKTRIISALSKEQITIAIPRSISQTIECGIHFTKDHSTNYFHWIIECLPRLSLIENLDQNIPLLIDKDLPKQLSEALELINISGRKLIKLEQNCSYKIGKLYYPSQLSIIHDNYNIPNYGKDAVYSASAIEYVRNLVLDKIGISNQSAQRKIYISRKNSDYRQLLNSTEIENILVDMGFEIVFPENLSFLSQVRIFSQAQIIIGQSGAGMANFIFAPKNCKVIMFMSDVVQTNLHLFGTLADSISISIEFLLGKHYNAYRKFSIHTDFYIDTKLLVDRLTQINIEQNSKL